MTDYFAHSVTRRVLLGFSKSDRNNFREMRKLAATFGPTKKLATEGQENRENYTGGSGYYLSGDRSRSGWTIRKEDLKYGLPRGSQAVLDFAHWLRPLPAKCARPRRKPGPCWLFDYFGYKRFQIKFCSTD